MSRVVLLTGGLGGARLAPALLRALGPDRLTVIANVGDDFDWMGLTVSPDVDSVLYALGGIWDAERGWGRREETFVVRQALAALGEDTWFGIGDRDLAFHLFRARRAGEGARPTEIVAEALERFRVRGVRVLPASDERCRTTIVAADGRRLAFQDWYVREVARPEVAAVELAAGEATAAALEALLAADAVILGPSNPVTSLGPILALRGVEDAVRRAPHRIAVSAVVRGAPSDDPGVRHHSLARERVLAARGLADDPSGVASCLASLAQELWIDESDRDDSESIRALGLRAVVAPLLEADRLARALTAAIG